MDKTFSSSLGTSKAALAGPNTSYTYPTQATHQDDVTPLLSKLSKASMKKHLTKFSSFNNRYYKSETGKASSEWLLSTVKDLIDNSGIEGASVAAFPHPKWTQDSVIATIPGKSEKTVVLGSHQDSINLQAANPTNARAPGADDNGSGSMTILEALTVFLQDPKVQAGENANTVEFHWYAAEEEGLLGSQAVFESYEKDGRSVAAMLAQDMTGYIQGTIDAGEPVSLGIITDFVNKDLTEFIKVVIDEYCTIPYAESKCGYAW
jgi:bacterial leucyl aminopeptidase